VIGIKKTHEKIDQAAVILLIDEITDSAESINKRTQLIREMIKGSEKCLIILINKTDAAPDNRKSDLAARINLKEKESLLFISAKDGSGLEELRLKLGEVVLKDKLSSEEIIITNLRHYEALLKVSQSLERVMSGLENQIPEDLIAIDIRQAIHFLGEITGEITTDEILGNIFKNFCIGK
jgi:tRNA modification GTPase